MISGLIEQSAITVRVKQIRIKIKEDKRREGNRKVGMCERRRRRNDFQRR